MFERFPAKWKPVRVKKTRQIRNREPCFDSIETEKALVANCRPVTMRREGATLSIRRRADGAAYATIST
jgi:hypothetical protein